MHNTREISSDPLISSMVGRELRSCKAASTHELGQDLLVAQGLRRRGRFSNISFAVRAGEIVGFAGLVGAGRTDVARSIFGADRADGGRVSVGGRELTLGKLREAISAGIGLVLENRKDIYLKHYADGHEPRAGIASRIVFYNSRRRHQGSDTEPR